MHEFDIVIAGNGPAGLSAAIMLCRLGLRTALIGPVPTVQQTRAETLSASARHSLSKLGVWDDFLQDGHRPCYGNCSAWGSVALHYQDSINHVNGHGWHLNRAALEKLLFAKAAGLGAAYFTAGHNWQLAQTTGGWIFKNVDSLPLVARFAADATGRSGKLARWLGIGRRYDDKQIALVALLQPQGNTTTSSMGMTESVADGWWYSAPQPDGTLACLFFTDADLHDTKVLCTETGWQKALRQTLHTRQRITEGGYALTATPHYTPAGSSRLNHFCGDGWLAMGDAAMSFDPLSAHGVSIALVSGIDAAEAIAAHLGGDVAALPHYNQLLGDAYAYYFTQRQRIYQQEKRWKEETYWKRREGVIPLLH